MSTPATQSTSTKSKSDSKTTKLKYIDKIDIHSTINTDTLKNKTLIVKPNWIKHYDKSAAHIQHTVPIYSIDIHCSQSRCATGGADSTVKIWNMSYILDTQYTSNVPKMLCQLTHHTAAVNALKFSHNGSMLATASDGSQGRSVIIYELSKKPAEKQLGTDYVAYENWIIKYSISAHSSDIIDLAYSIDDTLLATCSVDNTIAIFNTMNGTLIKQFKAHNDWVKGIAFDPLNRYVASMSSDCLAIWSLNDYTLIKQLERSIDTDTAENKAAANRYKNTSISRISFSPDGSIVTATSCHMNNKACSKLYSRQCWTGVFEKPVHWTGPAEATTVTRFSPCMYKVTNSASSNKENTEYFGLCAQGSKDRLITVWRTGTAKPVVVCEKFFSDSIQDIVWSNDGLMLLACSKDGTVCCIKFNPNDLPGIPISYNEMQTLMKQSGISTAANETSILSPALMKLQQQNKLQQQQQNKAMFTQPTVQPTINGTTTHTNGTNSTVHTNGTTASITAPAKPVTTPTPIKQTEIREPGKKRRIAPLHVPDTDTTSNITNAQQNNVITTQTAALLQNDSVSSMYVSTPSTSIDVVTSNISSNTTTNDITMTTDDTTLLQPIVKSKRDFTQTQASPKKPTTTTLQQNTTNNKDTTVQSTNTVKQTNNNVTTQKPRYLIELPNTAPKFTCNVPTIQHTISNTLHTTVKQPIVECSVKPMNIIQYIDSKYESTILYTLHGTVQWNDTVYIRITHICATIDCIVVIGYEGDKNNERSCMYVYTHAGRRIIPCIMLSAPVTHVHSSMHYFTIVTADAQLYTYSSNPLEIVEKYTFTHLIHKHSQFTGIRSIKDTSHIILVFTNNIQYIYQTDLQQFVRIVDNTNYLSEYHNIYDTSKLNSTLLSATDTNNMTVLSHTLNYLENQLYMAQYLNNIDDTKKWSKLYIDKLLSILPQQKQYFNTALHNKYLNKIIEYCTALCHNQQLQQFVQTEILVQLSTHTVTQTLATKLLQQLNSNSNIDTTMNVNDNNMF